MNVTTSLTFPFLIVDKTNRMGPSAEPFPVMKRDHLILVFVLSPGKFLIHDNAAYPGPLTFFNSLMYGGLLEAF